MFRAVFSFVVLLLLCQSASSLAPPVVPQSVLVLATEETKNSHSIFLSALSALKLDVTYHTSTSPVRLLTEGEYAYQAVVLLSPTVDLSKTLPIPSLTRFLDNGNSMFLVADDGFSTYTEKAAEAMGVDLSRAPVVDHQNPHELDDGSHTLISACALHKSYMLFGDYPDTCIAFQGPAATLFKDNELVDAVITGSPSTYASTQKVLTTIPRTAGSATVLAAALSTRTGGRAVYFGSFSALSNSMFDAAGEQHQHALSALLQWSVGARGMMHVSKPRHWSTAGLDTYRVRDELHFELDVHTWDAFAGSWIAFHASDMQVEFCMLDPWVRTRLVDAGNGTFKASIRVPDQIGVYKFAVKYYRAGVQAVDVEEVAPVRPYYHNEYERFIAMASPYYVAVFVMMVTPLVVATLVMLRTEEEKGKTE